MLRKNFDDTRFGWIRNQQQLDLMKGLNQLWQVREISMGELQVDYACSALIILDLLDLMLRAL
jgi:hypothetical protein